MNQESKILKLKHLKEIKGLLKQSEDKLSIDFNLAIANAENARNIALKYFYTQELADCLKQLSHCYSYVSDYGNVMQAALDAMDLYRTCKDLKGEADCLNILGGVYNFLQDYNKRLECNLKCLELRKKTNDENGQISSYNNIGDTYTVMVDYENALKYFNLCLTYELNVHMKAIVYYNIGEVHFFKKDYKTAQDYIQKGLGFGIETDYWQIIIAAYQMQANIFIQDKKYTDAIIVLEKALQVAEFKKSNEDQYPIFGLLSEVYAKLSDFPKAYNFLSKFNKLKDEVMSINNTQKLKKIEFEYQFRSITNEAEEIKQKNKQIVEAFNKIEHQRNEIETKNIAITDSIHYAKRIQSAILPDDEKVKHLLPNSFVFYEPKDIVSGDFYWIEKVNDQVVFSVIDCTGHGVPGAFVSLIAYNMINKVVLEQQITKPSEILNRLDVLMRNMFTNSKDNIRDGVDMGICSLNTKTNELQFSGAFHSLFICTNDIIEEIKGNRESIGFSMLGNKKEFVNHLVNIKKGSTIYLSTDGFPDQFGGVKGKKLKWKGLKTKLLEFNQLPITSQKKELKNFFHTWKNDQEQLDDVCIMGVELTNFAVRK